MKKFTGWWALWAPFAVSFNLVSEPNWVLVWSDEFDASSINASNWTYDTGGGGWGNNELEYYTDRPQNSYITHDGTGNGFLVIEARNERLKNRNYTSARLKTQGLQNWTYGKFVARIRIPGGTGVWPAFWMLGANFPTVGWPNCGELDIMEHVPQLGDQTIRGSAHGPNYSGTNSLHGDATLTSGTFIDTFHDFAIEWDPAEIRWSVDGTQYYSICRDPVCPAQAVPWVFDDPFFIILNVAIGGKWPGPPDATTFQTPVRMLVDWVRVFQDANLPPPPGVPLKVSGLKMSQASNGPNWQAIATVIVTDGDGVVQSGVAVRGAWTGVIDVGVTEATTDSSGVAVLSSGRVRQFGTIRFCVTDLMKDGYEYVPPVAGDCAETTR